MAAATSEENEIVRAIDDGEEKKVQKWLKKRSSDIDMAITIADDDESVNCTMLMHAAFSGRERIVKILLAHKASVNVQNEQGFHALLLVSRMAREYEPRQNRAPRCTPFAVTLAVLLSQAASYGHHKTAQLLIDAGADVTLKDREGYTALDRAKAGRHSECARIIQEQCAAVSEETVVSAATSEETEVVRAIQEGEEKKVQKWLKSGSSNIDKVITFTDGDESLGCTLLMNAAVYGRERIVKMLLAHKASVNVQTRESGATALLFVSTPCVPCTQATLITLAALFAVTALAALLLPSSRRLQCVTTTRLSSC